MTKGSRMPPDRSEFPSEEFLTRARLRSAARLFVRQLAQPFGARSQQTREESERRARGRSDAAGAAEPPVPHGKPCGHRARLASLKSSGIRLPFESILQLRSCTQTRNPIAKIPKTSILEISSYCPRPGQCVDYSHLFSL